MALKFKIQVDDKGGVTVERLGKKIKGVQGKTVALGSTFKAVFGAQALIGLMKRAQVAVSQLVGQFTGFQATMSKVKAITKASGKDFENLEKQAKRLGATTAFSASQAGQAFVELGKLGFETNQIIAASSGVLNLAAVAQVDMAEAAVVAAGTLRTFNLDASQTNVVVDIMAESFTTTGLDMEKFTNAMNFAGVTASKMGVSLEETSAALGVLANQNLIGSQAGTAMRTILLELGDTTSKVTKFLGGASLKTNTLAELFGKLAKKGLDATSANFLFGKRAVAASLIMAEQSGKMQELTAQFKASEGAADAMAKIMLDNVQGAFTILKSATEGFVIDFLTAFGAGAQSGIEKVSRLMGILSANVDVVRKIFVALLSTLAIILTTMFAITAITKTYVAFSVGIAFFASVWRTLKTTLIGVKLATNGMKIATAAWTAAQWLLNVALAASGISPLVLGLTALAALVIPAVILGFKDFGRLLKAIGKIALAVGKLILGAVLFDIDLIKAGFKDFTDVAGKAFEIVARKAKDLGKKVAKSLGFIAPVVGGQIPSGGVGVPPGGGGGGGEDDAISQSAEAAIAKETERQRAVASIREEFLKQTQAGQMQLLLEFEEEKRELFIKNVEANLQLDTIVEQRRTDILAKFSAQRAKIEEAGAKVRQMQLMGTLMVLGNLTAAAGSALSNMRDTAIAQKRIAQAGAVIDTFASANAAYRSVVGIPVIGPGLAIAAAGAAIVSGLANVAKIEQQSFALGGVVGGQGGATSDSEVARVSRGERILAVNEVDSLGGLQRIEELIDFGRRDSGGVSVRIDTLIGTDEWVRDNLIPAFKSEIERL